jgi:large subunit ribosomal protein L3
VPAIIGRKLGMTQIFGEDGSRVPLTVIEAGPCPVTQVKTVESDGYDAVQLGFGAAKPKALNGPELGHLKKAGAAPVRHLHEFSPEELGAEVAVGDVVTVEPFEPGQMVRVTGTSKGKGYAGTIKRHNMSSQRASHGNSRSHNVPGSIGMAQDPGRVFPGKRMTGHLGDDTVTTQNLEVFRIDDARQLILIKGAVPGSKGGFVTVRPAVKAKRAGAAVTPKGAK